MCRVRCAECAMSSVHHPLMSAEFRRSHPNLAATCQDSQHVVAVHVTPTCDMGNHTEQLRWETIPGNHPRQSSQAIIPGNHPRQSSQVISPGNRPSSGIPHTAHCTLCALHNVYCTVHNMDLAQCAL